MIEKIKEQNVGYVDGTMRNRKVRDQRERARWESKMRDQGVQTRCNRGE